MPHFKTKKRRIRRVFRGRNRTLKLRNKITGVIKVFRRRTFRRFNLRKMG